ncbi:putative versatile peroxidase [Gymnopilus junonius]|uniref:Peroxidase n=1 Tax=Gymnopilus junonius TaxID=109634 RepID=A0A9P5NI84_GYMJU|nr:putative versatile peroxidase [Gymnopilus junonius]
MAFKKALFALGFTLPSVFGLVPPQKRATCSDGVNSAKNAVCCNLFQAREDLLDNLFENECGDAAHGALRLIFHDAIGIDPTVGGGGADGSIATFNATELTFPANAGIDDVLDVMGPFLLKWSHVLSAGDFIQFAGALSLSLCPGAPQVQFAMGRPSPAAASPPDLVPNPFDTVDAILARFGSVGFSPEEVIALLSSHSIAGADDVDPSIPGTPFDISPSTFDTQIFIDVQLRGTIFSGTGGNQGEVESSVQGTLRLQSDHSLARDTRTACIWQSFANNQQKMASEFGAAVFKLSLLGQNAAALTDCSDLIPAAPAFTGTASFPPALTHSDVEQACASAAFPNLPTQPGPPLVVPPIPQADDS